MATSSSIPAAPGALPLLGHLIPLMREPLVFLTSLPQHGDLVRVRLGPTSTIVVCDPELTWRVLHDDRTFDKGGPFWDRVREVLGDGLGTCPRSRHRRQRRLVQPAFHPDRLPGYARAMSEQAADVVGSWRDGQVLDMRAAMVTLTVRTTIATLFSDSLPPSSLCQTVDDAITVLGGIYRRMLMRPPLDRLPTGGNRRYHQAIARLRDTMGGVISERRGSAIDRGDLLSALLATHDTETDGRGMSDAEVADQVMTFLLAGTESTADTLAWALHLLAQHPDIERRLHAEVDATLAGGPADHADLPRLELTGRVINETLRLYPPSWIFTRVVTTDTHLGGHPIPAGTTIACSAYVIHHRRPDLDAGIDRFDPDRWASGQPRRGEFIPFGDGARKCVGDRYSMALAPLALASITSRWQLQPVPGRHVRPALNATLAPRGLRMRAIARHMSCPAAAPGRGMRTQ